MERLQSQHTGHRMCHLKLDPKAVGDKWEPLKGPRFYMLCSICKARSIKRVGVNEKFTICRTWLRASTSISTYPILWTLWLVQGSYSGFLTSASCDFKCSLTRFKS